MNFFDVMSIFVITFAVVYGSYHIYLWIERRWAAKYIKADEFREGMRSAQVIDVREKDDFNAKHILGARNIPFSQFKQNLGQIRKDQPIYLCDDFMLVAGKAAGRLKRAGYKEIYILKGGLERWQGKVKTVKKGN
ncbi:MULTISPECIES: rhodanese-like domain-containing protein [unclassified Granulicatella]|uniref:rhodanese-like domain-containing protein n=1 Tax=unclassified Granulicatella TaxID=2630493 RepID=UPI001073BBAA|nr:MULTISPECIES: rhodanese-like domain-containing protein [unclassified Granulicatella]MBF0780989.1 rhodanese-like domain-containing protein [Granulicatella sp. 19428wC4_WM01]TFU92720.1 rhodanese-like domain-containing protein [Granulicatella sp. WM01]